MRPLPDPGGNRRGALPGSRCVAQVPGHAGTRGRRWL